jgi:AmmeMemoRadiSam system protein B
MSSSEILYPKLRAIDTRPMVKNGQPCLLLRDPLQLTDKTLIIPQQLAPVLALCDGTRENASAVSASLAVRYGVRLSPGAIEQLLSALDEACLLDNAHFIQARDRALAEYRQAPFRTPGLAGQSYPANADELHNLLQGYLDAVDDGDDSTGLAPRVGGLVSPHIDYARGGPVYARVWKRAADMVQAADLAVVLGTDHYGGDKQLTLTRQHYATPYGVLPTARDVVEALAEAMGAEAAFAGELDHRSEHSIELAAVWLHHIRQRQPCELVPILCGSFGPFIRGEADIERDPVIGALSGAFQQATAGRRVVVIAAGDLSHVGPVFGGQPLGLVGRARLQAADDELIERMCHGDADGFLVAVQRTSDRNNVCGVPPIYLALRMLGAAQGERVAYDRCPADENGTSVVSICGIVLSITSRLCITSRF